jgi:hypothetical protein
LSFCGLVAAFVFGISLFNVEISPLNVPLLLEGGQVQVGLNCLDLCLDFDLDFDLVLTFTVNRIKSQKMPFCDPPFVSQPGFPNGLVTMSVLQSRLLLLLLRWVALLLLVLLLLLHLRETGIAVKGVE